MKRLVSIVVAALLLGSVVAFANPPRTHRSLVRYVAHIDIQIRAYRGLLRRLDALGVEEGHENIDPVVEGYYQVADRFEDLNARWQALPAPRGLRVRHRGMGRVFELYADAERIHAAALFTRHADDLLAARPKVEARLRSAAYLQKRWAAALQGALIRSGLAVPKWLHGMATLP